MTRAEGYPIEHGPREGETLVLLHGGNVAGWMWEPQVQRMQDRHLLTPDLPGYGAQADRVWPGMQAAADEVAALIRERAVDERAHVVGLSLGGHVATHLLQRHPALVRSCTITGVASLGLGVLERRIIGAQVPLWHRRWYWTVQARAFGIPADGRELFVQTGSGVRPESNRAMFDEVAHGTLPEGPIAFDGPVLAVAAERESRSVHDALPALRAALPQLRTWIAPRVHHIWSIEDPELFARMVTTHADSGEWAPTPA